MLFSPGFLVLLLPALLVAFHVRSAIGGWRGAALALLVAFLPLTGWCALEWKQRDVQPLSEDMTATKPVSSETCFKCHESHYASWKNTYHRTMTREATPENVKGDFNDATHNYQGVTSHLTRRGDRFYLDTVDPAWEAQMASQGIPLDQAGPMPRLELSVDRLVGSHWFQQMLHRDEQGRYVRMPLAYHIVEKRWVHVNGVFLCPSTTFFGKAATWNDTCLYCHNTRPSKNPVSIPGEPMSGYRTKVAELGISCEACHGAGERHVLAHQNPARRLTQHYSGEADPTIINPPRLSVERSDAICARCHGGTLPRYDEWNRTTYADPFLPGRDLKRFWYMPFSEREQHLVQRGEDGTPARRMNPEPLDGRFWGDGTPLTTALEYQSMALSACYQDGHGKMTCLSCHSMHKSDPNHQVNEGMRTNEACYSCHEPYRQRLVEHTHHPADSEGSLCYNCHMPHQVYSLLDTHRSHRIAIPRVRDSIGTGKPHACNLCHLDKSLGWTQDNLGKWYGTKPEPLSDDDRTIASSLLHLTQSDARSRAIVAGAFAWPPAQTASGRDWPAMVLLRTLEHDRYEAVRYSAHKALRSLHGAAANNYDYQGSPAERAAQLRALRLALESSARLDRSRYPHLPITPAGVFGDDTYNRLLRTRNDPDVLINE